MDAKNNKKCTEASPKCERWSSYALLIFVAGFYGAYAFLVRGGAFCNAQTFNFVLCASALGHGRLNEFFYYFIPMTAYFLGAFISESVQEPIKRLFHIRWETVLMSLEMLIMLFLGLLPDNAPHQISQVTINLIASMQYNTFRKTPNVSMATTFCTNHLRQVGVNASHALFSRDAEAIRRLTIHCKMIGGFFLGALVGTILSRWFRGQAVLLLILPLSYLFTAFLKDDIHRDQCGLPL